MIRRIGFLHTVVFLADMFRNLIQEHLPDIESFHIVDESILQELMRAGRLSPKLVRRIANQTVVAGEAGADLIVFTCSSTSPAVDTARALVDIPVLKIDDPLAEKAVQLGSRIGLVTTAATTLEPSRKLIEAWAARLEKKVQVQPLLETEAFKARMSGDIDRHDRIVKDAVLKLAAENEVVVLAQASMAHLAEQLKDAVEVPILASPELCLQALKDRVGRE
jgi:Asp/Glu/hydantoin racemase